MKVNTITQTVRIKIDNPTLLGLFVQAVYGDAKKATGKDQTLYKAFGYLVGIADADAVKMANNRRLKPEENRITVAEFRRWLPTVFSEFAQAVLEASDEAR